MHFSAWDFVHRTLEQTGPRRRVLEIGSRDVNGSIRRLFIDAERYVGLDVAEGMGVDVAGMPADYAKDHAGEFDTVVCLETLEHDPDPHATIRAARMALDDAGGLLIVTAAAPGRKPHSAVDGGPIRDGEHYEGIDKERMAYWLTDSFGDIHEIELWGDRDIRAVAWTGERPKATETKHWGRQLAMVTFPR